MHAMMMRHLVYRSSFRLFTLAASLLTLTLCPPQGGRAAERGPAPLQSLPFEKLKTLAPLLRSGDLALLESEPSGAMRQVTTISLAAAPPAVVRDVLLHPERYTEFVRNMKKSEVAQAPDKSLLHTYQLSYTLFTIDGIHRYAQLPPRGDAPGAVELLDADPGSNGLRHYRWEFVPAGSGTVIALYGYTDVRHSGGVVEQLMQRLPSIEHGLALVSQMTLLLAIKARAEQLSGPSGQAGLPAPGGANYDFLLERGLVALLRTQGGRLADLSLIDESAARPELLHEVAHRPSQWSQFVPSISVSRETSTESGAPAVELEQSMPLLSFRTVYGVQVGETSVDLMGIGGDLRGGRLRWDFRPSRSGRTQLVLRTNQAYDRASMVIRQLYKLEPQFEYGINIGLSLLLQRGVKQRAEQLAATAPAVAPAH
jgi:hypothetical protein